MTIWIERDLSGDGFYIHTREPVEMNHYHEWIDDKGELGQPFDLGALGKCPELKGLRKGCVIEAHLKFGNTWEPV